MKATGMVRRVDDLGRIVLPKELRRTFGIADGDPVEIYTDDRGIILRKYQTGCTLCGAMDIAGEVCGKRICKSCAKKIAEVLK